MQCKIVVKAQKHIGDSVVISRDVEYAGIDVMLNEQVNCDDKEVVVWRRCLKRVPDVDGVKVVTVNDKVRFRVGHILEDTTGDHKRFIVEDKFGISIVMDTALES